MKTLVIGASTNPERYSFKATVSLLRHGFSAVPLGVQQGEIMGLPILNGQPELTDIDTVTLYLNPQRQQDYYSYIIGLEPRRIIFNPGTENPEFELLAQAQGIQTERACTLVLLSMGTY
jgi:uncharacterized protein